MPFTEILFLNVNHEGAVFHCITIANAYFDAILFFF